MAEKKRKQQPAARRRRTAKPSATKTLAELFKQRKLRKDMEFKPDVQRATWIKTTRLTKLQQLRLKHQQKKQLKLSLNFKQQKKTLFQVFFVVFSQFYCGFKIPYRTNLKVNTIPTITYHLSYLRPFIEPLYIHNHLNKYMILH